jgi:hypothetical protein
VRLLPAACERYLNTKNRVPPGSTKKGPQTPKLHAIHSLNCKWRCAGSSAPGTIETEVEASRERFIFQAELERFIFQHPIHDITTRTTSPSHSPSYHSRLTPLSLPMADTSSHPLQLQSPPGCEWRWGWKSAEKCNAVFMGIDRVRAIFRAEPEQFSNTKTHDLHSY